jgi:hypothetical protein
VLVSMSRTPSVEVYMEQMEWFASEVAPAFR